jgi:hypothetical protein
MDTSLHTLSTLFDQLGLDSSPDAIAKFVSSHNIDADIPLHEADFWNSAQASFIQDAIEEDADWAEIIDQLDIMLRD